MKSTTKYTEETTILVPDEVRRDYARFYTLVNGGQNTRRVLYRE